ncbi:hypothetical protein O181_015777 [Austropuccinia psidii MF-1]|uniref:Uncharacterized protein n=1 Tax=Austropuccinia psidii MF-1 TaxID=1389203 RepID=A0A9Q3C2Q9_9BASI|nr:hypothetical protein [Austropuccinia psidii MF-1]
MLKYLFLIASFSFTLILSAVQFTDQTCTLRFAKVPGDRSGTVCYCQNSQSKWFICAEKTCHTTNGLDSNNLYFRDCRSNGKDSSTRFFVWPTDFQTIPDQNFITVFKGKYSPTFEGKRTEFANQQYFGCNWNASALHNAVRLKCQNCAPRLH